MMAEPEESLEEGERQLGFAPVTIVVPTVTCQFALFHPFEDTKTLLVYNKLEPEGVYIAMYGGMQKPPAFGMSGGGHEGHEREIEELRRRNPRHWLLDTERLNQEERSFGACVLREAQDESGYRDLDFYENPEGTLWFLDYRLRDNSHRKITFAGKVESLVQGPVVETEEIASVQWIDLAEPIATQFAGTKAKETDPRFGLVYWSHVRRLLSLIVKLDRYARTLERRRIGHLVHHSWQMVFRIGRGDKRFPKRGYLISPDPGNFAFYKVLQWMIENKIEDIDRDFVFELFKDEITRLKVREQLREEARSEDDEETIKDDPEAILGGQVVANPGEGSQIEEIVAAEKRIRLAEDEYYQDYRGWMEDKDALRPWEEYKRAKLAGLNRASQ